MAGAWSAVAFRCLSFGFTLGSTLPRWVRRGVHNWGPQRWPELGFSIVDEVVWSLISAVESVAIVSMLCFFFLFCGCAI